jgi:putative membrane protein
MKLSIERGSQQYNVDFDYLRADSCASTKLFIWRAALGRNIRRNLKMIHIPKRKTFWSIMAFMTVYSIAITYLDVEYFPHQEVKEAGAATMLGLILSLLLAFRTNTAYDRWWEGRKLWGQLVNEVRNMGLKSRNYLSLNKEQHKEFADLLIAFPYALKEHLRGERAGEKVCGLVPTAANAEHVPLHIADRLFALAHARTSSSEKLAIDRLTVDPHLRSFMDICGACERIKSSPIVRTYKDLIWLLCGMYLLGLPWMLVPVFGSWAILVTVLATFFAVTLELLGEEVEDPFGRQCTDLPLDELCEKIERSVNQISE